MANNLFLQANVEFLGLDFEPKIISTDKKTILQIEPEPLKEPKSIELSKVISDLGVSDIRKTLGLKDGEDVKLKLSTLFLRIESEESKPNATKEYAVKIEVEDLSQLKGLNKIKGIVNIKKVALAAWNTENKEIIKQMDLKMPEIAK